MRDGKCPLCGCDSFYIKDPDDAYETYPFSCRDGKAVFNTEVDSTEAPELKDSIESFCQRCAWHGKLSALTKKNP